MASVIAGRIDDCAPILRSAHGYAVVDAPIKFIARMLRRAFEVLGPGCSVNWDSGDRAMMDVVTLHYQTHSDMMSLWFALRAGLRDTEYIAYAIECILERLDREFDCEQ